MNRAVGIDLGTTYSAVAWIGDSGRTEMIQNSGGDVLTPSVVMFEEDGVLVGKEARQGVVLRQERVAALVKRDMGNTVFARKIRGKFLPPEVIQACILRQLQKDIRGSIGPNVKVVITVPAFFDEPRRKATADAGEMAGLDVLDIVNEPTAAALAFGEVHGYLDPASSDLPSNRVLVYDLGGGTFDVTLIELVPGSLKTIATDGDVRLGGHDWDVRLADYVCDQFKAKHREDPRENPVSYEKLLNHIEDAKRTLSVRKRATVFVEHAGSADDIEVTQEIFESITADLLERTAYTAKQVVSAAGMQWKDVTRILLVGGSTRMPMVSKMLHKLTGIEPDHSVHPDEAVARGAAIYSAYLLGTRGEGDHFPHYTVTNVNSHSLGIEGIDVETRRKRNVTVLGRNTPLPADVTRTFVTKSDGQRSVVIQVLEGESPAPDECTAIARTVIRDLPTRLPAGSPVDVTFEYATNGRLSVRGRVAHSGQEASLVLQRAVGLSDDRLNRWRHLMMNDGRWDMFETIIEEEIHGAPQRKQEAAVDANADMVGQGPGRVAASPVMQKQGHTAATGAVVSQPAPPPGVHAVRPPGQMANVPARPAGTGLPGTSPAAHASAPTPGAPTPAAPAPGFAPPPAGQMPGVAAGIAPGGVVGPRPAGQPAATVPTAGIPAAIPAPAAPAPTSLHAAPSVSTNVSTTGTASSKSSSQGSALVTGLVYLIFSLLGLLIGYYILSYVHPEGNFLHLNLPGLPES